MEKWENWRTGKLKNRKTGEWENWRMGKLENRKTGEQENRGMGTLKNRKTGEWEMKDGKISGSAMTIKNKKLRCQRHLAKECEALHFLPVPKAQQKVP